MENINIATVPYSTHYNSNFSLEEIRYQARLNNRSIFRSPAQPIQADDVFIRHCTTESSLSAEEMRLLKYRSNVFACQIRYSIASYIHECYDFSGIFQGYFLTEDPGLIKVSHILAHPKLQNFSIDELRLDQIKLKPIKHNLV